MRSSARVVQILLKPQIGGAETLVASLADQFSARGIENSVAYLDPQGSPQSPWARIRHLRRELKKLRATHVLAHSALPNLYMRLAAPSDARRVCVLHSASDDWADDKLRVAERSLLWRTDAVVAVSEAAADQYVARFPSMRPRVHVINNGIPTEFSAARSLPDRPTRLVSVARVARQKNPQLWVDVVKQDAARHPGTIHEWWGPAGDEAWERFTSEHNAGTDPGHFRGPTTRPSEVMHSADVFLHTADAEANSIVLLEAAASGLPLVCSESVARTLPHGLIAHSFTTGDAGSCLEALESLRNSWADAVRDAARASDMVREGFGIEHTADRYLALLELP